MSRVKVRPSGSSDSSYHHYNTYNSPSGGDISGNDSYGEGGNYVLPIAIVGTTILLSLFLWISFIVCLEKCKRTGECGESGPRRNEATTGVQMQNACWTISSSSMPTTTRQKSLNWKRYKEQIAQLNNNQHPQQCHDDDNLKYETETFFHNKSSSCTRFSSIDPMIS